MFLYIADCGNDEILFVSFVWLSRRLLLSSVLIIFASGSNDTGTAAAQAVAALLLCVASIKVYQYYRPFSADSDDQFSELVQWVLAAMFLAALMIRVDTSSESVNNAQAQMSGLLITVVLCAFIVLFWFVVKEFRNELNKDKAAVRRATNQLLSNVKLPLEKASRDVPLEAEQMHDENTLGSTIW